MRIPRARRHLSSRPRSGRYCGRVECGQLALFVVAPINDVVTQKRPLKGVQLDPKWLHGDRSALVVAASVRLVRTRCPVAVGPTNGHARPIQTGRKRWWATARLRAQPKAEADLQAGRVGRQSEFGVGRNRSKLEDYFVGVCRARLVVSLSDFFDETMIF